MTLLAAADVTPWMVILGLGGVGLLFAGGILIAMGVVDRVTPRLTTLIAGMARIEDPKLIDATDPAAYRERGRKRLIPGGLLFGAGIVVLAINVLVHGLD